MKKLLIVIFSSIFIKTNAQTTGTTTSGFISGGQLTMFSTGKTIVSKDTIFNDTTKVDILVIDPSTSQHYGRYADIWFTNGYRVDVRKGEWYRQEELYNPPGSENDLVAHFHRVDVKPPVVKNYYLDWSTTELKFGLIIKELK